MKIKGLTEEEVEQYEMERADILSRMPHLEGKIGITRKGLYMHNPQTGFNEVITKVFAEFTGVSPY